MLSLNRNQSPRIIQTIYTANIAVAHNQFDKLIYRIGELIPEQRWLAGLNEKSYIATTAFLEVGEAHDLCSEVFSLPNPAFPRTGGEADVKAVAVTAIQ